MATEQSGLAPIFLSASIPDPRRDPRYSKAVDVIAIREATCALAEVVLPVRDLSFGGHPAISPLVAGIATDLQRFDAVTVYQSEHFRHLIPKTTLAFTRITWTAEVPGNRDKSLLLMRESMLDPKKGAPRYAAGFFIGGMEGIEAEFELFRRLQPQAAFWPIATTTGAAALVYSMVKDPVLNQPAAQALGRTKAEELLERSLTYRQCFREILEASDSLVVA
jgi:hypothetical protein